MSAHAPPSRRTDPARRGRRARQAGVSGSPPASPSSPRPLLWAAGMWTSPPAAGTTDIDYVTSLGRDGTHHAGVRAVPALRQPVHRARCAGRGLAAARAARGPADRRRRAAHRARLHQRLRGCCSATGGTSPPAQHLPVEQAAKVFDGFKDSSLLFLWNGIEMFSLLGTILLLAGLARAGVLGWWTLAVFVGRRRRG